MPGNAPSVQPSGAAHGFVGPAYRTPSTVETPSYSILRAEVISHHTRNTPCRTIPYRAARLYIARYHIARYRRDIARYRRNKISHPQLYCGWQ